MIEEKEKLNRSFATEANSSLNRSMKAEVKRVAVVTPAKEVVEVATKVVDEVPIKDQDDGSKRSTEAASPKEEISEEANIENWKDGKMEVNDDVLEAAKEETEDVIDTIEELQEALEEKKDIEEVQEILEEKDLGDNSDSDGLFVDTSNDASKAWQEAKEEMLEKVEESTMDQVDQVDQVEVEESAMDETLPSNAPLLQPEATMQTFESQQEENEAKEDVVEEAGEVKDDVEDEQCSLEKEEEGVKEKDNGENVISGGGEGQTSDEEERDEEKESIEGEQQGGALGLRRELRSDDEEEEEKGGN